ncbi:MAG: hypothetical protein PVG07_15440, partial [Acidobacteriota bacterium]
MANEPDGLALAEHLRKVHFSLIVACFACLVALSVEIPSDIQQAKASLSRLRVLEGMDQGQWLAAALDDELREASMATRGRRVHRAYPDYDEMLAQVGTMVTIESWSELPEWVVAASGFPVYDGGSAEEGEEDTKKPAPTAYHQYEEGEGTGAFAPIRTVADVQSLWAALAGPTSVWVPVEIESSESSSVTPLQELFATRTAARQQLGGMAVRRFPFDYRRCEDGAAVVRETAVRRVIRGCTTIAFGNADFRLGVRFVETRVNLLPRLTAFLGHPSSDPRFEIAFPHLAERARGREGDVLEVLAADLAGAEEAARQEEGLTLLGVSVPVARLTLWGGFALLCLQLYFVLHLKELTHRLTGTENGRKETAAVVRFPWIAFYPGRAAATVTVLSACLLPLTLALLLALGANPAAPLDPFSDPARLQELTAPTLWLRVLLLTGASGVLAWRSGRLLRTLRAAAARDEGPEAGSRP